MKVRCEIEFGVEENEDGYEIPCTYARCTRCGHETMSYGDGDASVRRCLVLMREECPESENNFYVARD